MTAEVFPRRRLQDVIPCVDHHPSEHGSPSPSSEKEKNLQVPLLDQSTWAKTQPCEPVLVADEACVPKAYQTLRKNKKGIEGKDLKTTVEFRMLQALV